MEKKIITISREYGSGGRQIGLTAAKKLGMEFYDKELIDAAAKEIGFPAEIIADREQRLTKLKAEVDALNTRVTGWAFVLPAYKYASLDKPLADLLKPVEAKTGKR